MVYWHFLNKDGSVHWHDVITVASLLLPILAVMYLAVSSESLPALRSACRCADVGAGSADRCWSRTAMREDHKKEKEELEQDEAEVAAAPWRKEEVELRRRARNSNSMGVPSHADIVAGNVPS